MTIKTDNRWKKLKYGYELPRNKYWRKEKDWLTTEEFDTMEFVKTPSKRQWFYALDEFMSLKDTGIVPYGRGNWNGYLSETVYSGILIQLHKDGEHYKIAYYYT